jgi:hypothetical protein
LAERVLGKDEVTGSIPVIGSRLRSARDGGLVGIELVGIELVGIEIEEQQTL